MSSELTDFFVFMKSELLILAIIFIVLFIKVTGKDDASDSDNHSLLVSCNLLLLLNFVAGFFGNETGSLFGGSF